MDGRTPNPDAGGREPIGMSSLRDPPVLHDETHADYSEGQCDTPRIVRRLGTCRADKEPKLIACNRRRAFPRMATTLLGLCLIATTAACSSDGSDSSESSSTGSG